MWSNKHETPLVIGGHVQVCVLSRIPDNFHGVAEMVLDRPPNHQEST